MTVPVLLTFPATRREDNKMTLREQAELQNQAEKLKPILAEAEVEAIRLEGEARTLADELSESNWPAEYPKNRPQLYPMKN